MVSQLRVSARTDICGEACATEADAHGRISGLQVIRLREKGGSRIRSFLEITTDLDARGISGELFQDTPQQFEKLMPGLFEALVGRNPHQRELGTVWLWNKLYPDRPLEVFAEGVDPLTGEKIWGTRRERRHTPTGTVMMAISAVDNALWDLRGKLAGKPVRELLGGRRTSLPVYLSQTPSDDLPETKRRARSYFDQGFKAQKWFLRHGPPDGEPGFRFNVGVVESLRTELGPEAKLMFDFAVGGRGRCDWDVPYATRVAKAIEPFKPYWLESPFHLKRSSPMRSFTAKRAFPWPPENTPTRAGTSSHFSIGSSCVSFSRIRNGVAGFRSFWKSPKWFSDTTESA